LVRATEHASSYVAKYASKPLSSSFVAIPARLIEAIKALRGRRLVLTFGTWAHLNLLEVTDQVDWQPVMPLWRLRSEAASGDPEAVRILTALIRSTPCQPRSP
jgi:hypothetical protein